MTGGFLLLRPLWLLALPPLMALAIFVWRRRAAGAWAAVLDPALLPVLRRLGLLTDGRHDLSRLLPLLAAAMMALALSGPALRQSGTQSLRVVDPLILLMDMSPSVVADPKLLGQAQAAAAKLLTETEGRPAGLLLYAADAYLASAPTTDRDSLLGLIAVLDARTMPVVGSRPDIALSMARDLFTTAESGMGGADLVLISDGGGAGPQAEEQAARLATEGARVWALTLPQSAAGAPAANPPALTATARAGGGAALDMTETTALAARIEGARTARLARDPRAADSFRDLGPWLLPLALVALFPLFRRRK